MATKDKTQEEPPEELLKESVLPVSVEDRFRDVLLEIIWDVGNGGMQLPLAKHKLHFFIDSLSEEDQNLLYTKITATAKRVRDIADGLTSETPSLLAKMQR